MCENKINTLAAQIADVLWCKSGISANVDNLSWVLQRFRIEEKQARQIDKAELREIIKVISTVPTGKQRHYRYALDHILSYLKEECLWDLPEEAEKRLVDRDNQWISQIACEAGNAGKIFTRYEAEKCQIYAQCGSVPLELAILVIAFEVAPLTLRHIAQILSNADSIVNCDDQPRLRVYHALHNAGEEKRYTHYYLSLFCYRVLHDFYASHVKAISEDQILSVLNHWSAKRKLPEGMSFNWQYRFQILWFTHYRIPALLLKDLSYPERHVGFSTEHTVQSTTHLFDVDWDLNWYENPIVKNKKLKWLHTPLLKSFLASTHPIVEPPWNAENILPKMLYLYTADLLVYGGVKKSSLATSTIEKYTNLIKWLEPFPLSYADATNEEALLQWASTLYRSVEGESSQLMVYYFLKFMSVQELTETLDLATFTAPTTVPTVNAFRIELPEFDAVINALVEAPSLNPLRNLFAVLAALLGNFGMLRRGEVTRLRNRDFSFDSNSGLLTIRVTHTAEGKTKSGHSRVVHTIIPTCYRNFFKAALVIKAGCDGDSPFIGFEGEAFYSRQLYYLLPVTRALKAILGRLVTFHHLRHSGAHLLMIQALRGVSQTPKGYRIGTHPLEQELMSNEAINCRFKYWLEGRPFSRVNHGVLLDEVCGQIGHAHYATTRFSYLHDIEWLLPIVSPAHCGYTPTAYSHQELRYLLGLSPASNDLSRVLTSISPAYANKSTDAKRAEKVVLTEDCLRSVVFKTKAPKHPPFHGDHYQRWQTSILQCQSNFINYLFRQMLAAKRIDFISLSQVWCQGAKHPGKAVEKACITALKTLPPVELSSDEKSLVMQLACNVKNAQAFSKVFRHKEWQWLTCSFELATNRKLRSDRQEMILRTQFCQGKEKITVKKHALGQTQLTVCLSPKFETSESVMRFTHQFLIQIQSNKELS
ncbi:site-specific integrase [Shewanella sp. 4t3-1-2LB]|uniref:site-specific integrase n=1 Tax=Shewanella sp. 4t3-1-2LB TaxID=2817682 RepID=UPI001A980E94|nr:site-specific integrase [Shewanella sp. 4t3-1-2LB]MBO1273544.1 site-specific integrase [Shewanella sp. 4t3-1-2LB]